MRICHHMSEDARLVIKQIVEEYEQTRRREFGEMQEELAQALEPHLWSSPLSGLWRDPLDDCKKVREALVPILKKNAPRPCSRLREYYDARIAELRLLFSSTQSEAQFPDLPQAWLDYSTKQYRLLPMKDFHAWELLTWHYRRFNWSTQEAAQATIQHFFRDGFRLPDNFADTLLKQTVDLWGKTPVDIFLARMNLYFQDVLRPALEELKIELADFGKHEPRWEKSAPVGELVAAILETEPMQDYRALVRSVCLELDTLAESTSAFKPEQPHPHAFPNSKLGKSMKCAFIDAKDFSRRFMTILDEEIDSLTRNCSIIQNK